MLQGGHEPFSNLVKKASRWINEEKAVHVTNLRSISISRQNGENQHLFFVTWGSRIFRKAQNRSMEFLKIKGTVAVSNMCLQHFLDKSN